MRREWSIFTLFCLSVLIHGLFASTALRLELREMQLYLPPLPNNRAGETPAFAFAPDDPIPPDRDRFGEAAGEGYAINSAPGEQYMSARQAEQDQAWLSRDPMGPNARMPLEPSQSTAPPGQGGSAMANPSGRIPMRPTPPAPPLTATPAQQPLPVGVTTPPSDRLPIPIKLPERLVLQPAQTSAEPIASGPTTQAVPDALVAIEIAPGVVPAPPLPALQPAPRQTASQSEPAQARPGAAASAADPAPMADSESDPFARVGSVTFRGGRVDARFGRQHKLIKPRLGTKALVDLISIAAPRMVLKVTIDETGKVTDVGRLHSNCTNEIEQPTIVALYQSWFEPSRDKEGKPMGDVIVFSVNWR